MTRRPSFTEEERATIRMALIDALDWTETLIDANVGISDPETKKHRARWEADQRKRRAMLKRHYGETYEGR